jgi:tyrosinase
MDLFTPWGLMADPDLPTALDRRVFVKGIGLVGMGLLTSTLGGCEYLADAIKNRPVRRRLRTGSPEVDADIATYRQAVAAMKALPASDPRSWAAQAEIHGTVAGGFNFCEHGTDHFFDWHRAYLLYFERICQKLTGNPKFGLPYWNWNQNPVINPAFLDPASTLFLARNSTDMTTLSAVSDIELNPIFGDTNFFTFSAQIEGTPHNLVHVAVGQTMLTGGSPLDPVFWTHHCMVDYCWVKWNIELGNNNTNDTTWINHVNEHFVDADGNAASSSAGLTILMPLLSYRYESSAIGSSLATEAIDTKAEFEKLEKRLREGADIRFEVKQRTRIAERATISIATPLSQETALAPRDFAGILESVTSGENVFANVQFARLPSASDFFVRVFLNLSGANGSTPITDPHYAGSFAFFGTESTAGSHSHRTKFLVNVTDTLRRLRSSQELGEGTPISIQLVAVPFDGTFEREDMQLMLEGIDIITTPIIVSSKP